MAVFMTVFMQQLSKIVINKRKKIFSSNPICQRWGLRFLTPGKQLRRYKYIFK